MIARMSSEGAVRSPRLVHLKETYSIGDATREVFTGAEEVPALAEHHITFTGMSRADRGFCFIRLNPPLSQVLVTTEGAGRVYSRGRWELLKPGMAYITPRHVPSAYHRIRGMAWECYWVTYVEPEDEQPTINVDEPTIAQVNPRPLQFAISGMLEEYRSAADPGVTDLWVQLIHRSVKRIVHSWEVPDRLWDVWRSVAGDPSYPWTVFDLAKMAHISEEYLRQLCHRHHGRSPMEHVMHLRMRHARDLLGRSNAKLQVIAEAVGYESAFTFSRAFKRWIGVSPDEYRKS